ncbi:MAG: amidohydrolase/deacetylase family metallohydrolase, partial [Bryobacteraceae bacterium]|nr:amidohydrolase/deacetylase family metallohydrolase [Bryobacteraceae bacterium]
MINIVPVNRAFPLALLLAAHGLSQEYDLMLRGGRVLDPKNKIDAVRDVAIRDGKIAAVEASIDPAKARKVIDVSGLYVTPGLIDIHAHVYTGTAERSSYAGDNSVYPDGFTFRSGVTTVADAGSSGWRNFPDFKDRVISRSRTRVLAFLNIVGNGMRGSKYENDLTDMDAAATTKMALANKEIVVGIKCAHYSGPEWTPVERAVEAGKEANVPVMIDFGSNHPSARPLRQLLTEKLRPGDIYTHLYSGLRNEIENGKPGPGLAEGRKRGIIFDVGHGGGSFLFRVAGPLTKAGFWPDSISTDLHIGSMNGGMKDMLNVASKLLALGMRLPDVIAASTWNPAREIHREELGNLSVGSPADIAVIRLALGEFGFSDHYGGRLRASQKLVCEATLRDGRLVYDLNG